MLQPAGNCLKRGGILGEDNTRRGVEIADWCHAIEFIASTPVPETAKIENGVDDAWRVARFGRAHAVVSIIKDRIGFEAGVRSLILCVARIELRKRLPGNALGGANIVGFEQHARLVGSASRWKGKSAALS